MTTETMYYDTLKRIATGYQSFVWLQKNSEKKYGLPYLEALEMAYENMQEEATRAIKGKRRPKTPPQSQQEG